MPHSRSLALCCWILYVQCSSLHAQIPPDVYHKTDEILSFFKTAASQQPQVVRYNEHVEEVSGAKLPVVTITDFASGEAGKEVLLLMAGEHGRELITSDIIYWLGKALSGKAEELLHWPTIQSVLAKAQAGITGLKGGSLELWLEGLLQKCVFKIVPVVNIGGRKAVEGGNLCQRTAMSGVDLNRNWPYAWKLQAADLEEYGGPKPFSEPEARMLKALAADAQPRATVNLHSGEYALYVPWDSEPSQAAGLPADTDQLLDKLNVFCQCMHGAGGKVAGYLAFGTSMDYFYKELQVPYPFTMEVYGPGGTGKLATGGKPRQMLSGNPGLLLEGSMPAHQLPHQLQGSGRRLRQQLSQQQAVQQEMAQQQASQQQALQGMQTVGGQTLRRPGVQVAQDDGTGLQAGAGLRAGAASNQTALRSKKREPSRQENEKCFRDYNPATLEGYQDVVATWLAALLTLAEHLAANPRASLLKNDADQQQLPLPPVPPFKQDLAAMAGTDSEERLSQSTGLGDFRSKAMKGQAAQTGTASRAHVSLLDSAPATSHLLRRLLVLGGLVLLIAGVWMKMGSPVTGLMQRRRSSRRLPRLSV